jgi:predicted PurR-regulated permease PerM
MKISVRDIIKILSITTAFVILLLVAYLVRRELLWIGTAFFLAVAVNPAVERLTKVIPKHKRGAAIAVVFAVGVAVLLFVAVALVPPLVTQSEQLAGNLPHYAYQLEHGNNLIGRQIHGLDLQHLVRNSQDQLGHYVSSAGGSVFAIVRGLFSSFAAGVTILGLMVFMLLEGPGWLERFWRMVPDRNRPHLQHLVSQMYEAVAGYVSGNLLTSLLAAVLVSIMLAIVHVPFAIPLGILVGLFDLLPLVGATIGAVLVIVVALFTSATAAIVMAIFFAIYQQLENHLLQPVIYGRTVQMSPLTVLISVLIGAQLGGIIGAIVAIPVGASVQILVRDFTSRRLNGKNSA